MVLINQAYPKRQANRALFLTTLSFSICFACWVVNAMLVTYLIQNGVFDFSAQEVGWLIAAPILTGAISRVPLGVLTDKYGGRIVMAALMLFCALPMYLLSYADSFTDFLVCSLGFGMCGGGFAVGAGYVSTWFPQEKQGTVLGIFGMGNAGAAITSLAAPQLLSYFALNKSPAEAWQMLPKIYAAMLVLMALIFFVGCGTRLAANSAEKTLSQRLSLFKSMVVWRFGMYYALLFGSFIAMSQWLVPYTVNVYQITLAQAGVLAAIFSLPSGVIRGVGGWLSDRYGARSLMTTVFLGSAICCTLLAIPKMNIFIPGVGVSAKTSGLVTLIDSNRIIVSGREYNLTPKPAGLTSENDAGTHSLFLPSLKNWHEANVKVGEQVKKDQLIASGVSNLYYPANIWIFVGLVFIFGILTGVGKAGVFKYIPEHFPDDVGAVAGIVGLIGAMGGFILLVIFSVLLTSTGIWATSWIVIAILSVICLIWMQSNIRRIMESEAPNLAKLIESSAHRLISRPSDHRSQIPADVEALLQGLPFFHDLSHEELHAVAKIGEFKSMAEGELIFKQGDPGDALYVLITGKVAIYLIGEDGNRIDLAQLGDGAYFGDLALIDGQPRSASATTSEHCEFFLVGRQQFLSLMTDSPRILADVLIGLSEHIRNTNQRYVDINEKKERLQLQAELDRHQSIAQMVAGVAHEINTPLGIVNHAASIITEEINNGTIEEIAKDEDAEEILESIALAGQLIQDNIRRADKLITSFKNLSVRQIVDQKEKVSIGEVIEDVLRLYSLKAQASNLDLSFENELENSDLWDGYAGPLSQIMLNIISNADRYAYPEGNGGKLEVKLIAAGPEHAKFDYVISVKDFGVGIAESEQEKVFEAFFTTGRSIGGTGIGLSVVYNLVTFQLDGAIELDSEVGKWSRFTIYLPKFVKEKHKQTELLKDAHEPV